MKTEAEMKPVWNWDKTGAKPQLKQINQKQKPKQN